MKRLIIVFLLLILSRISYSNGIEYCKEMSLLLRKIENVNDKNELLNIIKGCYENLKSSKEYIILLSKLYFINENYHFAKKILVEYYKSNQDCEIAGYIAYTDFMLKDRDSLKDSLGLCENDVDMPQEQKSRISMLNAILNGAEPEEIHKIYPEDYNLLLQLNKDSPFNYEVKAKIGSGYTTNAFSIHITERESGLKSSSSLIDYDFGLVLKQKIFNQTSLGVDSSFKGTKFLNEEGNFSPHNQTRYSINFSPYLGLSNGRATLSIRYTFDTIFLNMDTEYQSSPVQFFEGHRGEIFLTFLGNYALILGGGKRYFDEMTRSRTEIDGGFGYFRSITYKINTILLLTNRYYNANSSGYDNLGQSLLLKLDYRFNPSLELSQYISLNFDNYLNSTGYFMDAKRGKINW